MSLDFTVSVVLVDAGVDTPDFQAGVDYTDAHVVAGFVDAMPSFSLTDMQAGLAYVNIQPSIIYVDAVAANTIADYFLTLVRLPEETVSVTDNITVLLTYFRPYEDSTSVSDNAVKAVSRILTDAFTLDDMVGADAFDVEFQATKSNVMSVADTTAITTQRPVLDGFSVEDSVIAAISTNLADSLTVAESMVYEIVDVSHGRVNGFSVNQFVLNS
tara:strand:- start:4332 stop:4976 length:645 start_codon:yes stop_codon:yes gene_type:complete